jgi:4-alpha-glucanotransferase
MNIRRSGVLLHPTSLPGRYGIGDLGKQAYEFIDFLFETGQKLWQVLPLHTAGYGNSPYQCFSVHAGNPLLISPDMLREEGFLSAADVKGFPFLPAESIDYDAVARYKIPLLRKAFLVFENESSSEYRRQFDAFCEQRNKWLNT